VELRISVRTTGAALDPATRGTIMARAMMDAEDVVARRGATEVRAELGRVLQHPTGYYESRVTPDITQRPPRVWDQMVVYGPWLEGIGSRNATTRFKGYSTFRRVAQRMQRDVVSIVGPVFSRAVRDLNR
jgi:hypothetical protein